MGKSSFSRSMLKITLLLDGAMYIIEMGIISTIQGQITMQFHDAPTSLIGMVVSITGLFMLPVTLISGKICQYVSKKNLLVTGVFIYALSGISIAWLNNLTAILAMRALMGIGIGLSAPIIPSLITKYYEGKERYSMFGLGMSVACFVGIVSAVLGGIIAAKSWHNTNYLFLFGFIMTVLAAVYIPAEKPESVDYKEVVKKEGKLPPLGLGLWLITLLWLVVSMLNGVFAIKIGYLILSEKIGSASSIGMLMGIFQIGALIIGLVFSKLFRAIYRFTALLGVISYMAGFLLLGTAKNMPQFAIGVFLIGGGMVLISAYGKARVGELGTKVRTTISMAIFGTAGFVGTFLSSFWAQLVETVTGNNGPRAAIMGSFYGYAVIAVCLLVFILITGKSKTFNTNERLEPAKQPSAN